MNICLLIVKGFMITYQRYDVGLTYENNNSLIFHLIACSAKDATIFGNGENNRIEKNAEALNDKSGILSRDTPKMFTFACCRCTETSETVVALKLKSMQKFMQMSDINNAGSNVLKHNQLQK